MATEVTIVGGGVIGLATAYFLRQRGADVRVLEARRIGSGASWGNSGWIAPSFAAPIPAKGLVGKTLRSLRRPESPVYLAPRADLGLATWAWRFWRHCNDRDHHDGTLAAAALGRSTHALYDDLVSDGVGVDVHKAGLLMVALDEANLAEEIERLRILEPYGYGAPGELLRGSDLHAFEPFLSRQVAAGVLVERETFVEPTQLTRALADAVTKAGGEIMEGAEVTAIERTGGSLRLHTTAGTVTASQLLLAAGAWTPSLARMLGGTLPLQAGKGYSFSTRPRVAPSRPIHFGEAKVVVTPLPGRTRVAGTMELSGRNLRLDRRRISAIERAARTYVSEWPEGPITDEWVGMRPLAPDGLPILGRLPACADVYVATGHSMSGITLAPATGLAMSELILSGCAPSVLGPFGPGRFS